MKSPSIARALLASLLILPAVLLAGGCNAEADVSKAEEEAFKNPDRSKMTGPPPGGQVVTPAKSSLDTGTGGGPPAGSVPAGPGGK